MAVIVKRLVSLAHLARPLMLTFAGIVFLTLCVIYSLMAVYQTVPLPSILHYLALQLLPYWGYGLVFGGVGLLVLAWGIWQLSSVLVIPLSAKPVSEDELVLGYRQPIGAPNLAVLSGGAGMLIPASLGRSAARMVCITPVQDPVEYYYRASSLYQFQNIVFVVPTPQPLQVEVQLDDGQRYNIKHNISHNEQLSPYHVTDIRLLGPNGEINPPVNVAKVVLDALAQSDAILLGPGSLFESILPNLLIPQIRDAIKQSQARKIYLCSLMTEPGLTTGFGVAEHIRQIIRFGGFTPDYVLVNAQRIDPEVRQIYEAAGQTPVYLNPEDYEETIVRSADRVRTRDVIVEGAVVIEADLASSMLQLTASLERPGENRTVRVLRHDPDKLAAAIMEILRRG